MKPVNLLPARYRPSAPSGARSGSAYFVLGALGAVLVAVVVYAFIANQVTAREDAAAEAAQAAADAEARAGALAPFGDFRQVRETRVASVRSLAEGRLDWERLWLELAHVLPPGVRLDSLEGSSGASESAAAPATSDASTSTSASDGPSVVLAGCAASQPMVAKMLVRLRRLNGAEEVTLQDSSAAAEGAASASSEAGAGGGECPGFTFNATVVLAPAGEVAAAAKAGVEQNVPASLGGGR